MERGNMRIRTLVLGALALLSASGYGAAARAQDWGAEMAHWHALCDQGDRRACVRFGVLIGEHRERHAEWRRTHPDWWWWEH